MSTDVGIILYPAELQNRDLKDGFVGYRYENFDYFVKGESKDKRDFIITEKNNCIHILNYKGKWIKTIHASDLGGHSEFDWFRGVKLLPNGRFSVFMGSNDNYPENKIVIFDSDLKICREIDAVNDLNVETLSMDEHAYYCNGRDTITVLNADNTRIPVDRFFLQERYDHKVVWEWDNQDSIEELRSLIIRNPSNKPRTPHINSFGKLDDDNLLISFRNVGLACLNKSTKQFKWFIAQKRNDFNFEHVPILQHGIEFLNDDHTKFLVFNNNWLAESIPIRQILEVEKAVPESYKNRDNCYINIYDLNEKTSKSYKLPHSSVPRQGNVIQIEDNVFDVNYGLILEYNEEFDKFLFYGEMQELNVDTGEVNMTMRFPHNSVYSITRGYTGWTK